MALIAVPAHVRDVARSLAARGYSVVVVGGSVRDALLGRQAKDWDLATDATPAQVSAVFPATRATTRFGTAIVPAGGELLEITTFRTEADYDDYRRPSSIGFTRDVRVDLARRDFTVNAIAYDPLADRLIDPFGGRDDLRRRTLRAVGRPDERFAEDALRLLRAVRFEAQLGFTLDPATAAAVARHAPLVERLAPERVGGELVRLLGAERASAGLADAQRLGLLGRVLPELGTTTAHGVAVHRRLAISVRLPLATALAALCHDVPDASLAALARRLNRLALGGDVVSAAGSTVRLARAPLSITMADPALARALRPFSADTAQAAFVILEACAAEGGPARARGSLSAVRERVESIYRTCPLRIAQLDVDGDELMRALRLAPGPPVGRLLQLLLEEVTDGRVANRRAALLARARQLR